MNNLNHCWLIPKKPPLFIQLGRYGDLILLFPAFKLIYDRTGFKPYVIVSSAYSNIFDGITYALPNKIEGHWYSDMPKARALAAKFGDAIIPQWWQPGVMPDDVPAGAMVLQCHGHGWGVDPSKYPDFGTSMWVRAGFTREEMIAAPLVFDRRDAKREEALFNSSIPKSPKPLLLYNFTGISSPFGYVPEMMRLLSDYRLHFNMVDLGHVRAHRLYDFLGIYDRAAGLITTDTATMHLAPGSKVPTLWLTVDGWGTSVPRGNVALHVKYSQTPKRLEEIRHVLESWKSKQ